MTTYTRRKINKKHSKKYTKRRKTKNYKRMSLKQRGGTTLFEAEGYSLSETQPSFITMINKVPESFNVLNSKEITLGSDESYYNDQLIGASNAFEHNVYIKNIINGFLNDFDYDLDYMLIIFEKMLSKTFDYKLKNEDFLKQQTYNLLLNYYESDNIMDLFATTGINGETNYDLSYDKEKYDFLKNIHICNSIIYYLYEKIKTFNIQYNIENSDKQINVLEQNFLDRRITRNILPKEMYSYTNDQYFGDYPEVPKRELGESDTLPTIFAYEKGKSNINPDYYDIYSVSDLKRLNETFFNNDLNVNLTEFSKYLKRIYVDDASDKNRNDFSHTNIGIKTKLDSIIENVTRTYTNKDFKEKLLSKALIIKNFHNNFYQILFNEFVPTVSVKKPESEKSPSNPDEQTTIIISKEYIEANKDKILEQFYDKDNTSPISIMLKYLISIKNVNASIIRNFEAPLNIKFKDDSVISYIIEFINEAQKGLYVYDVERLSVTSYGGGKSAKTTDKYNDMGTILSKNHGAYDNAHDFEFNIQPGDKCTGTCKNSIINADTAIKAYAEYNDNIPIVGTDSTIKNHISALTFREFSPFYLTCAEFKLDNTFNISSFIEYIKKNVFNIDKSAELTTSKIALCHDMGSMFTEVMIEQKLPKSSTFTPTDKKDPKEFHNIHNSTLLKTWDSSTGGFNIGDSKVKDLLLDNTTSETEKMNVRIAYNVQALLAMLKYFVVDNNDTVRKLFINPNEAYVPVLQSIKLDKTLFNVELFLIKIEYATTLYSKILELYKTHKANRANFISSLSSNKIINIEGYLMKNENVIRTSEYDVIYPNKKYSVNAILSALSLPVIRKGETNKLSIDSLTKLLTSIKQIKNGLTGENKIKYLFMIKHSGDTCQGIQTGIAFDIFNLILGNSIFTGSVLYTEDTLAFCNAVFQNNVVMTIIATNDTISVCHTKKEFSMESFLPDLNNIYKHLTDAIKTDTVKSEIKYFNDIIKSLNNIKKTQNNKDDMLEVFARINEYKDYLNLKKIFEEIQLTVFKNNKSMTDIKFGKYESLLNFNTMFLEIDPSNPSSKKASNVKLGYNKFIDTYHQFNGVRLKHFEQLYNTPQLQAAIKDEFNKNINVDDKLLFVFKTIIESSEINWIETIFNNIYNTFKTELNDLLNNVNELVNQYKKLNNLNNNLKSSNDRIYVLLNNIKFDNKGKSTHSEVTSNIESRLSTYKKGLTDELNGEIGKKRTKQSSVEFVTTEKIIKYNLEFNVYTLVRVINIFCKAYSCDATLKSSPSFFSIKKIVDDIYSKLQ